MNQRDSFKVIGNSYEGLKEAAQDIAKEMGVADEASVIIARILHEIDKMKIIDECKSNYERTGKKLTVSLKKRLAEKYYISEKAIEKIVYENFNENKTYE